MSVVVMPRAAIPAFAELLYSSTGALVEELSK